MFLGYYVEDIYGNKRILTLIMIYDPTFDNVYLQKPRGNITEKHCLMISELMSTGGGKRDEKKFII